MTRPLTIGLWIEPWDGGRAHYLIAATNHHRAPCGREINRFKCRAAAQDLLATDAILGRCMKCQEILLAEVEDIEAIRSAGISDRDARRILIARREGRPT